jgi:hypothetical protein
VILLDDNGGEKWAGLPGVVPIRTNGLVEMQEQLQRAVLSRIAFYFGHVVP